MHDADKAPITTAIGEFIAGSQSATIDDEIRDLARRHILDTLASIVACRDLEPAVLARQFSLAQSGDARANVATVLGTRDTAAVIDAVFAGAMTGHGAEINDFVPSAFVQPGPAIVATALAVAENRGLTGDAVVRAVVVGYELASRVPKALGVGNLRRAGIANHGIGPVFGAAACAASLLALPHERIGDVLTYCAQQASGSWQWLLDVEHIEKSFVFAGMGARNGVQAALMVEAGFRGVRNAFDQPGGWLSAPVFAGGDADPDLLVAGLGDRSELHETAYKRYPVGGPTQPAVEGLLHLLDQIGLSTVDRVTIEMPGRWQAFRDAAMPALNLRYLSAIILIDRRLDFTAAQSLDRMHHDAAVAALMDRVEIVHDPDQEAGPGEPRTESARVTVTLATGERPTVYVPHVVGFPSNPMSRAEVESKAFELMAPALGDDQARAVIDHVSRLDGLPKAGVLAQLIARD